MARPFAKVRGVFERPKGSGVWWIRYADQYGRIHRERVGSRSAAIEAYRRRKDQVKAGAFFPEQVNRRDTLFEDMAKLYLEEYSRVNKRSYKDDCIRMNRLMGAFSGKSLREITTQDVERFKARLAQEVAPATVNHHLKLLKALFNKAIEWGKADSNPVRKVKLFRENNARVRYLTGDEETALMRGILEEYRPIVIMALHTGLRRGELFGLRWQDVNFATGVITIPRSKHGEARHVPMNQVVRETLRTLPSRLRSEYVFASKVGTALNPDNFIHRVFEPALRRAKIEDFRFHDLRHTFASRLVMAGVDLMTVKELMGHKDIRMTLRYSHLSPGHLKEAVEVLGKGIIRGQTGTRTGTEAKVPSSAGNGDGSQVGVKSKENLVGGAGFEPATFGL